jgi:hypothetical protein
MSAQTHWHENHETAIDTSRVGIDSGRAEGVRKYGDVKMAEPAEGKFPIDTDAHIRAAEGYKRYATPEGKEKIDAAARAAGIGDHP